VDHLRLTVRDPDENDRLIAAAIELSTDSGGPESA
jgi:histidinol-phosphate/aromatic aminotransferase/cobyric acid decarboxylase-like protein